MRRKWARPPPVGSGRQRSGARSALVPPGRPPRGSDYYSPSGPGDPGRRHKNPSSLHTSSVGPQGALTLQPEYITDYPTLDAPFRGSFLPPSPKEMDCGRKVWGISTL